MKEILFFLNAEHWGKKLQRYGTRILKWQLAYFEQSNITVKKLVTDKDTQAITGFGLVVKAPEATFGTCGWGWSVQLFFIPVSFRAMFLVINCSCFTTCLSISAFTSITGRSRKTLKKSVSKYYCSAHAWTKMEFYNVNFKHMQHFWEFNAIYLQSESSWAEKCYKAD